MTPSSNCVTCRGTGLTPARLKPCSCTRPCRRCGIEDRLPSGFCRPCNRKNSAHFQAHEVGGTLPKEFRQTRIGPTTRAPCRGCGETSRDHHGRCVICWRDSKKNWVAKLIKSAIQCSKDRGHVRPSIDAEWIRSTFTNQGNKCFYLRVPLWLPAKTERIAQGHPWQPSLDRVDSTVGYTPENTRITSWFWNRMRNAMTVDETFDALATIERSNKGL